MKIPNFILGGIMKSGTTFLHNLLINHPQVKVLKRDMSFSYFDDDRVFKNGENWDVNLFSEIKKDLKSNEIVGQTSADCAFNPQSVQRIMDYNPNTKLIFVLRHPIDRAYSLYWHQYGMGREHKSFEKAIDVEANKIKKSYYNFKNFSYLERSKYYQQFQEVKKIVPEANLLILDFESLTKNTLKSINSVLDFLEIDKISDIEELGYSNLPRNRALIPKYKFMVKLSHFLQKFGFVSLGRKALNMTREEVRPPKMNLETRKQLEQKLAKDIQFYNEVKLNFNKKIN
ncbi:sulfotransferase [Mesonia sp.]|uniref:sulfotransferase family protein n=1 Tax=Mesonia sp. TaxID=1960830 RepID=UPI00177190CA|nr:sulfotransferase [Mesonia sp.]HIB38451.1 hypothetical protein [Mesonia sp.]